MPVISSDREGYKNDFSLRSKGQPIRTERLCAPSTRLRTCLAGGISESDYFLTRVIFVVNYVRTRNRYLPMALDSQAIFATERERVHMVTTIGIVEQHWS